MPTLVALLASPPIWLPPLGWGLLLLGWAFNRPTTARLFNKVLVIGLGNTTTTEVSYQEAPAAADGESPLAKAGSWASLIGLALTAWPMLKEWLK